MSDYGKKWEQQKRAIDRASAAVGSFRITASTPAGARASVEKLLRMITIWENEEQAMKDLPE